MIQLPPFDADDQQPIYDYAITLTDVEFRIVLLYRERQDRWYLSLYDTDEEPLVLGQLLPVNVLLFEDLEIEGMPAGKLAIWDSSGAEEECGWGELGQRCELVYFEPGELPPAETYNVVIEPA